MITLNQDIEILKNFAIKHKGINTFYFGDEWEVGASNPIVYPLMLVVLQNSVSSKGIITRKYVIEICDLVNTDESNENQVLSDVEQICYDLPNYLRIVQNAGTLSTFKVKEDISLNDFTEKGDDASTGFNFEIEMSSHIGNASCNLPITAGGILDGNYIYLGGSSSSTTCLPVIIYDQDGNILQTFINGGTYTVTVVSAIDGGTPSTIFTNTVISN